MDIQSRKNKEIDTGRIDFQVDDKPVYIAFITPQLKQEFDSLKEGKFEDRELYGFIDRATDDLKKDPTCGIKIKKQQWPKEYIKKYEITNLWKYDLPNGWRLIYTIESDDVKIMNIVLEWFSHKEYERRFHY